MPQFPSHLGLWSCLNSAAKEAVAAPAAADAAAARTASTTSAAAKLYCSRGNKPAGEEVSHTNGIGQGRTVADSLALPADFASSSGEGAADVAFPY